MHPQALSVAIDAPTASIDGDGKANGPQVMAKTVAMLSATVHRWPLAPAATAMAQAGNKQALCAPALLSAFCGC